MMIPFAKNQVLVADSTNAATIYTDPVALGDNDRAFVVFDCHQIYGNGTRAVYTLEVSNDGVNFTEPTTAFTQNTTTAVTKSQSGSIEGAFLRVKLELDSIGSGDGGAIVDVLVNVDKE